MKQMFIFCSPNGKYREMNAVEAGKDYTRMSVDEYSRFVSFREDYKPHCDTPDLQVKFYQKSARKNEDRKVPLQMTLFTHQDITNMGGLEGRFVSSRYLLNPLVDIPGSEEIIFPDLDVVHITGEKDIERAAKNIKEFYEKNSWKAYIHNKDLAGASLRRRLDSPRFQDKIRFTDPIALMTFAMQNLECYDPTLICFNL